MKIPYMLKKKLKNGHLAYYFCVPARRMPENCKLKRSYALGEDYIPACQKALKLYEILKNGNSTAKNTGGKNLENIWNLYISSRFYNELEKSTQDYYRYQYDFLCSAQGKSGSKFKEIPLDNFSSDTAYNLYENILEKESLHKALACMTFLKMIYNFGLRKGVYTKPNPFANLRVKHPKPKKQIISTEDLFSYIRLARENNRSYLALALELNYWLAQRVSDIRNLKKDNIVKINDKYFFDIIQHKTKKRVFLPIPTHLLDEVLSKENYIIADKQGYFTKDRLARHFNEFSKQIGIKIVFKQMRHTAATAYAEAGVNTNAIISITGHTNEEIYNQVYKADTPQLAWKAYSERKASEDKSQNENKKVRIEDEK